MIPGGDFLCGADAALFGGVLAQKIEGEVAQGGEVRDRVAGAHAAGVFAQGDIEHPMQGVFDASVAADGAGQLGGFGRQAAQVVAPLARGGFAEGALGFDHGDAAQCGPLAAGRCAG